MNPIIQECEKRNITKLIHFTCLDNLESILTNGLLTRKYLNEHQIEYHYNDEKRLDDIQDSISLSITSPNYKMFYKIRSHHIDHSYIVLELDPSYVLELNCAFCYKNAASNEISSIPLKDRETKAAFIQLFKDRLDCPKREDLCLLDKEPTDPQAEILVLENIPVKAIKKVYFHTYATLNQYATLLDQYHIDYEQGKDSGFFRPRHDHSLWKKGEDNNGE